MSKIPKPVRAFAWRLEDGSICHWAEPTRTELERKMKPSPGAKPVEVFLYTRGQLAKLRTILREYQTDKKDLKRRVR